jgi:chromosome segregation ATPase
MLKTEIQSLKNTLKEAESSILAMKTEIQTLKERSIEAESIIAGFKTEVQSIKDSSREAESNIVKINHEMSRTKYEEYYIYSSSWDNTITSKAYSAVPG